MSGWFRFRIEGGIIDSVVMPILFIYLSGTMHDTMVPWYE